MAKYVVRRLLKTDGNITIIEQMSFNRIRKLLKADELAYVNFKNGMVMCTDKHGHGKKLGKNPVATALWEKVAPKEEQEPTIVGDVCIVPESDIKILGG